MMTITTRPSFKGKVANDDKTPTTNRSLLNNLAHGIKFTRWTFLPPLHGFMFLTPYVKVTPLRLFNIPMLGPGFLMDAVISIAGAIRFLHRHSYTHGKINPMNIAAHSTAEGVQVKLTWELPNAMQVPDLYYQSPLQMNMDPLTGPRAPSRMDDMWAMGLIICFLRTHGLDMYTPFLSIMPGASVNHVIRHTLLSLYDTNRDSDSLYHLNAHASLGVLTDDPSIRANQKYQRAVHDLLACVTYTNNSFCIRSREDMSTGELLSWLMRECLRFDPLHRLDVEVVMDKLLNGSVANDEYFRLPSDLMQYC
jgi:serine/threonine protein kinase